mmetsp:Transcript_35730/g.81153  ORF Transcript_35730/g.81153 Transcript_35730/m.81153 type:complete len:225 (-) Transcript_35730:895-1569(-)
MAWRAPPFPAMLSSSMPIVMRDGNPCGLKSMSGVSPESVNGMSSAGQRRDRTPFWPWRDENLSPGTGLRLILSLMDAFSQSAPDDSPARSRTSSTIAVSDDLCRFTVCLPVLSSMIAQSASPGLILWPTSGRPSDPRLGSNSKPPSPPSAPSPRFPKLWQSGSPFRRISLRSIVVTVYTDAWPNPRSYELLFTIIASSMSYPVYEMTATTALVPIAYSSSANLS